MIKLSRKILLDLLRDIGKNQTALMADYLSEKIHFWLAISSAF